MLGVFLGFALASLAAPEQTAPQPSQSAERICRGGGGRTLGSHIRTRRRCLTADQWRQEDEARERAAGLQVTEGQNDGRATATPQ